jgi:5S rRNA maturation endonuclease (ribonuclease M5)/KaiC/GvpD/RAD55 family RecA-like ATPase
VLEDATLKRERVRKGLQARVREFVRYLYPRAVMTPRDARIGDASGARGYSMSISLTADETAGRYIDHANGNEKGDIFGLYAVAHSLDPHRDFPQILAECDQWLGGAPAPRAEVRHKVEAAKPVEPEPTSTIEAKYVYRDKAGKKICEVARMALSNGKKTFVVPGGMPTPRPLYGLERWHTSAFVVLVEGEKCADALTSIGVDATTLMGGSSTIIDKTDLTPLAGKTVILWPDNDAPGFKLMDEMAGPLAAIGCIVQRLNPPAGKPDKWDAADAIAEGFDVVGFLKARDEPAPPAHGLAGQWIDDIAYAYEPELIEGLIPSNGVGVIYGPSSAGKSFITVDWAMRIASGGRVLGRFTEASGVLYFAAEGQGGLRKRLVAARQAHGMDDVVLPLNYLPALLDLSRAETGDVEKLSLYAEDVAREMRARGAPLRIVVIDTLAAAAPSADENAQKDMGPIMLAFHRMANRLGAVVLLVAHTGKDVARGLRGWSGIRANADFAIECRVDKDEDTGETSRRSLWLEKAKDGRDGFTLSDYALRVVEMGTKRSGEPDTTCRVDYVEPPPAATEPAGKPLSKSARLVMTLLSEGPKFVKELVEETGLKRPTVQLILSDLAVAKHVYAKEAEGAKLWYVLENEATPHV